MTIEAVDHEVDLRTQLELVKEDLRQTTFAFNYIKAANDDLRKQLNMTNETPTKPEEGTILKRRISVVLNEQEIKNILISHIANISGMDLDLANITANVTIMIANDTLSIFGHKAHVEIVEQMS
jgi:hypothetical protein